MSEDKPSGVQRAATVSFDPVFQAVLRATRATAQNPLPDRIEERHSFLGDLAFDSMALTTLALALEDELGIVVLLDAWVRRHSSPMALTVGSLCEYLRTTLPGHARQAV